MVTVWQHAREGLENWRLQRDQGVESNRVDILQLLIEHGEKNSEDKLTDKELITEIMETMLAGGDTIASTLACACYELTRFPDEGTAAQQSLLQSLGVDADHILTGSDWPFTGKVEVEATLKEMDGPELRGLYNSTEIERIRSGNALRLIPRLRDEWVKAGLVG